jgi:hypothetical protein
MTGCRVHYVILRRRPLEDSTVVGWHEKMGRKRMAFSLATTLFLHSSEDDWNTLIAAGRMEAPPRFFSGELPWYPVL